MDKSKHEGDEMAGCAKYNLMLVQNSIVHSVQSWMWDFPIDVADL